MPARVIPNGGGPNKKNPKVEVKEANDPISLEMESLLTKRNAEFSNIDRAAFYTGNDRLNLQGSSVQRVRELQEENDHLQREIAAKENELVNCIDPLSILADIEHRKIIIARNTGEILKIYLKNEERIKRIKDLEAHNTKIHNEMMEMQGRFISTKDMEEKTNFASEFFILKSEIEKNIHEINELSKN